MSERRACRVVGQARFTQRLAPPAPSDDELRAFLRAFSAQRPRWGWRRAYVAAREAGYVLSHKKIQRLWREEGLKVPYKKRKRPLRGIGVRVGAMCPTAHDVIWAMDFQFDQTADGRQLKLLNVVDEFTRERLAIKVERSIDADHVVRVLERLARERRAPRYVRFDIHTEFRPTESLRAAAEPPSRACSATSGSPTSTLAPTTPRPRARPSAGIRP